jgi:hypothetical protein
MLTNNNKENISKREIDIKLNQERKYITSRMATSSSQRKNKNKFKKQRK